MLFTDYLMTQLSAHPSSQPRDVIKQCYQAAFGAEHLLTDPSGAETCFWKEYEEASFPEGRSVPPAEPISPKICRISLPAWKQTGMPGRWLFRMFLLSVSNPQG